MVIMVIMVARVLMVNNVIMVKMVFMIVMVIMVVMDIMVKMVVIFAVQSINISQKVPKNSLTTVEHLLQFFLGRENQSYRLSASLLVSNNIK